MCWDIKLAFCFRSRIRWTQWEAAMIWMMKRPTTCCSACSGLFRLWLLNAQFFGESNEVFRASFLFFGLKCLRGRKGRDILYQWSFWKTNLSFGVEKLWELQACSLNKVLVFQKIFGETHVLLQSLFNISSGAKYLDTWRSQPPKRLSFCGANQIAVHLYIYPQIRSDSTHTHI